MKFKTTVYNINLTSMSKYEDCRIEAARLWNDIMKLHKYIRKRHWKWSSEYDFKKHFKKKGYQLHSQTIQGIIEKFFSNIDTTRTNRKNGNKKARYPYKTKKHFNVVWKGQAIKIKNKHIILPMGKGRKPHSIKLPKNIIELINSENVKICLAELSYFNLGLTIKQPIEDVNIEYTGVGAIDLGLIHTGVITDGKEAEVYVGRALRSINQGYHKSLAKIVRKQSRCIKYSRKWKKLQRRKKLLAKYRKNYMRNFYHHISNKIVDFCVRNKLHTLVYGDITNISHRKKKKMSKRNNQAMSILALGQLMKYCEYKLKQKNIEIVAINEAYTSQTCPTCGHRHKVKGRVYKCKQCGFTAFRDEVGAYNILNKYLNDNEIIKGKCIPTNVIKYLRPIKHIERSSGYDKPVPLVA